MTRTPGQTHHPDAGDGFVERLHGPAPAPDQDAGHPNPDDPGHSR